MIKNLSAYVNSLFSLTNHEVYVITAKHGDRESGQAATWVMPATLVPDMPRIVAVLSPQNYTYELIEASGGFVLNLLAEDQYDWVPLFGLYSGREHDKFAGIRLERSPGGLPVLPGTCGWAECLVVDRLDTGDRMIILAEVTGQKVFGRRPLHKYDAFEKQPAHITAQLVEKHRRDGERDRAFIKRFRLPRP